MKPNPAKATWARRKAADARRYAAALAPQPGKSWRECRAHDATRAMHLAEADRFERMADRWDCPGAMPKG